MVDRPFASLFEKLAEFKRAPFLELTKKMRSVKALPKEQKSTQAKAVDQEIHKLLGSQYSEYKSLTGKNKAAKGEKFATTGAPTAPKKKKLKLPATPSTATSAAGSAASPQPASVPSAAAAPTPAVPKKKKLPKVSSSPTKKKAKKTAAAA